MSRALRWAPVFIVLLLFAPLIWTTRTHIRLRQEAAVEARTRDSLAEIVQRDSAKARARLRDSTMLARLNSSPRLDRPLAPPPGTMHSTVLVPRSRAGSRQPKGIP